MDLDDLDREFEEQFSGAETELAPSEETPTEELQKEEKKVEEEIEEPTTEEESTKEVSKEDDLEEEVEEEVEEEKPVEEEKSTEDADEESAEENGYDILPFVEELHSELGFDFDFDGEKFSEEFGNDIEGLKKFIGTVIEQNSEMQFPNETAKNYYDYISKGGDPSNLSELLESSNQYESVDLDEHEDNTSLQRDLVYNLLAELNPEQSEDWVKAKIDRYENSGTLFEEAKDALDKLKNVSSKKLEDEIQSQKAREEEETKKIKGFWEQEKVALDEAEDIAGVKLTDKVKENFFKYYSSGKFSEDLKDPKVIRELAFINFIGLKGIERKVETKKTKKVEEGLTRHSDTGAKVKSQSKKTESNPTGEIDYNELEI